MASAFPRVRQIGFLSALLLVSGSARAQTTFIPLGDLPGGVFNSQAFGMNNVGTVVVGKSSSVNGSEAARWTAATGWVGLGDLPALGFFSIGRGVSGNGGVMVGCGDCPSPSEGFRKVGAGGGSPAMVGLGFLPGGASSCESRAADNTGTVLVGYSDSGNSTGTSHEAFRWTAAGGMVGLGDFAGGNFTSEAHGVSGDGGTVVGFGSPIAAQFRGFRWRAATGIVNMGTLPLPNAGSSKAFAVSRNGNIVVGQANLTVGGTVGSTAVRWSAANVIEDLGDLAGGALSAQANAVNQNGSVVVGRGRPGGGVGDHPFIWFQFGIINPMKDLHVELTNLNAAGNLAGPFAGWTLREATGVSDDGTAICGWGVNPTGQTEGWLVTGFEAPIVIADLNGDGAVNGVDLGLQLLNWGQCAAAGGEVCLGDLTGNGEIDGADLGNLLLNWTG